MYQYVNECPINLQLALSQIYIRIILSSIYSNIGTMLQQTFTKAPHLHLCNTVHSCTKIAKCLYLGCRGSNAIQIVLLFHTINSCSLFCHVSYSSYFHDFYTFSNQIFLNKYTQFSHKSAT